MLSSWSHSRLVDFDTCKRMVWLKYVERIPEPERPLPPGKQEHANDRGTRIHELCEAFVKGDTDELPFEAEKHFSMHFAMLRTLYDEKRVVLEGEWGVDRDWNPCNWHEAWHRCKLDAYVALDDHTAIVIDYKTGRKYGNEIKHGEQMQIYALNTITRHPLIEHVRCELWYLDIGETSYQQMSREQALRLKHKFTQRGLAVTSEKDFPPNPNRFSCKYCRYGTHNGGTGHCTVGVPF